MAKQKSFKHVIYTIIIVALVMLAIILGVFYSIGFRYIRIKEGVRYFGLTAYEQPISGTLYYEDGLKGKLNKDKDSDICTIIYNNGDVYEGQLKGIMRHGNGKMTFTHSKDEYVGNFENDYFNGFGTYTYENGNVYEGEFVNGQKQGTGLFTWYDGSYYYGSFENNKRHGVGEYRLSDGSSYIGSYAYDKKNGNTEVNVLLLSGETYVGKNRLEFSNGDVYIGDFLSDERTGSGEYLWSTGERYTGQFQDGVMDGKGVYYRLGDAAPYDGYFENGSITIVGEVIDNNTEEEENKDE